jgi:hypothetical protein
MKYKRIKILVLRSNPIGTDSLRLDEEIREIQAELERAKYRDRFEILNEGAVRVDDLSRSLLKHKPDIVHFSGHGLGEDGLVLEDDTGKTQRVPTGALLKLFEWCRESVKCVLLNACYSDVQAKAIHQHIHCVVGMNQAIGDRAAIQFAAKFYQSLLAGESFQSAYTFACTGLELLGNQEFSTPQLLNRTEQVDPFGITESESEPESSAAVTVSPKLASQHSQTIGNVNISGSNNPFNAIQSGGNVILNQSSTQTTATHSDLQIAVEALARLKHGVSTADALNPIERATAEVPINLLEAELQKPTPDKSVIDQAIAILKKTLDGVITLAEPVTQVAALIAKAYGGLR